MIRLLPYGYEHHIQRLMMTGLYCLLHGVRPQAVHEWDLAIHVDAIAWAELPDTLGMSQYAESVIRPPSHRWHSGPASTG